MQSKRLTRQQTRGFTLLEVLVALTIVAIALAAAMRGALALTASTHDLDARILATLVAQNELAEVRLSGALPASDTEFDCAQGGVRFICHRRVKLTPNPNLRWVLLDVSATDAPQHRLASQMMLMPIN